MQTISAIVTSMRSNWSYLLLFVGKYPQRNYHKANPEAGWETRRYVKGCLGWGARNQYYSISIHMGYFNFVLR